MAIPVHLQQFKAAGIYRVVFDKSTIMNVDTQILRMVVGYSEQGPFNIPVYVKTTTDFRTLYGDISKKLEKRGIYFHRTALQALTAGPILCLNLKKFDGETVDGATINTSFDPKFAPIDTVKLNVEDIYDTSRFWELSASKLNELRAVDGSVMDQYINICTTNTTKTSATYFIRKASGIKVSSYNISVNSWYSDNSEEMPEYLENYKQNLVSDFFAEIYVFKGKFTPKQVLASETLKKYFVVKKENDEDVLYLRNRIYDAFGDPIDTLDALYNDETSGALGHYIGSLIPYFKNKQGSYAALDILFNSDQDVHNMMMSFNTDMVDEGIASLDLSGRLAIKFKNDDDKHGKSSSMLECIYNGDHVTKLLGNLNSKVVSDEIHFTSSAYNVNTGKAKTEFVPAEKKISGTLYVNGVQLKQELDGEGPKGTLKCVVTLKQVASDKTVNIVLDKYINGDIFDSEAIRKAANSMLSVFGVTCDVEKQEDGSFAVKNLAGALYYGSDDVFTKEDPMRGPTKIITMISRIQKVADGEYNDPEHDIKINTDDVDVKTYNVFKNSDFENSVYGSSVSFVDLGLNWEIAEGETYVNGVPMTVIKCATEYDKTLLNVLQVGDCILAADGINDKDMDGEYPFDPDDMDGFFDNVYVQDAGTAYREDGSFDFYYVALSGMPYEFSGDSNFVVRIDGGLNQEIGDMTPQYFEGYTYKNPKPNGLGMMAKVEWQNFILSTLTDYKGLRTALLNKSEIDYRYIVDSFESYPVSNLKSVLSFLCKEKQSAFCLSNFPSVQTFVKCPYSSFTDSKGLFNVEYVVNGFNKKKPASVKFSIPADMDGASFIAFYTPLKFSDGYVDNIVPAAGLVSNLFMQKYMSRQPYYIVAGPNYGVINASGLVGPDYKYSMEELQIIEPFGVNCMVYRPNFGTFINANQTAKQIPLSALSKVNVRELVIYLQDEVEKVLQAYQWEFNNAKTRQAILDKANTICELIKANGGIQAYVNIMDESNNTPEIIDNEMAVLSTHIEPGMGCGKMVHELTLYRTGQMAASIS